MMPQERPVVLISRCLLGVPCRYHGRTHTRWGRPIGQRKLVAELEQRYRLVDICPEADAGMPTPRPPTHIKGDRWICDGEDVTATYRKGAKLAVALARKHGCRRAYLKRGSPACDPETGMTGKALQAEGLKLVGR